MVGMKFIRNIYLFCSVLLFVACQQEHSLSNEGSASLYVTIKGAESALLSRGIEDLDDNGTVSEEEMMVDGRKMYRLVLFLMEGNAVAGHEVLEYNDQRFLNNHTEAAVEFKNLDYSKTYQLYAVANYGNYGALTGNLANVNTTNLNSGLKVTTSTGNICAKSTPYPLTLKQQIELSPGVNTVSGQLVRTYARLRINVRNQSNLKDLYITKLEFPAKFAQSNANLFTEGGSANVSIVATSPEAVTPFDANNPIPKINTDGTVNEATIFDTYLLESNGGTYSYTLGLKYTGGTEKSYVVSSTALTNNESIEDGAMYVISNTKTNADRKSLYANVSTVGVGNSYNNSDGKLNNNYVWKFKRTSGDNYTIESVGATGFFMRSSAVSTNSVLLGTTPANNDYFTVGKINNGNRTLKSTASNKWGYFYYVSITGNSVVGSTGTSEFKLYKVTDNETTSSITSEAKNIPIHIIDKNSGEPTPLTAIRRNDFIEILVNVTYNDKTGNIQFEVSGWDEKNGEVEFD